MEQRQETLLFAPRAEVKTSKGRGKVKEQKSLFLWERGKRLAWAQIIRGTLLLEEGHKMLLDKTRPKATREKGDCHEKEQDD